MTSISIIKDKTSPVTFGGLKIGQFFYYQGILLIKIGETCVVPLGTGCDTGFTAGHRANWINTIIQVIPVDKVEIKTFCVGD